MSFCFSKRALILVATMLTAVDAVAKPPVKATTEPAWGHSHLGPAYDQGPRSKPWIMEGIGKTHFPVTSTHPEVQTWFDQGHTLLHSFWRFEAERAFRWCVKLDPDCAMAYLGTRTLRPRRAGVSVSG